MCTGNGARSQIAEAILRERASDRVEVVSAGSHPKPDSSQCDQGAGRTRDRHVRRQSKPIDQFRGRHFDYVITLCDKVREVCPEFPGNAETMHWSIEDPSLAPGSLRETLPVFRALATELESRIGFLTALIDNEPIKENTHHGR